MSMRESAAATTAHMDGVGFENRQRRDDVHVKGISEHRDAEPSIGRSRPMLSATSMSQADAAALPLQPSIRLFRGHYHRLVLLAGAEAIVTLLAFFAALAVSFQDVPLADLHESAGPIWPRALVMAAVTLFSLGSMGLYQLRQRVGFAGVVARVLVAVMVAQVCLALVFYVLPSLFLGRGVMLLAGALAGIGLPTVRYFYMRLVDQDVFKRRVMVWGSGERAAIIGSRLRRRSDQRGFRVLGYVRSHNDPAKVDASLVLPAHEDPMDFITRNRIEEVVVAMDDRRQGFPTALLRECRMRGILVRDVVNFLEHESGRVDVGLAQPSWLIFSDGFRSDMVRVAGKRAFDIAISLAVLVLSAPLAISAAIAIYVEDRGPILYRQVRTGKGGKPFQMYKFRSMGVNAESKGAPVWAAKNDPRVTRVGAFLRRMRIDEIPQAINVLMGEMSFVGPRPERPAFVEQLSKSIPFYAERHFVKPGLTGWAQVSFPYGSSETDAREKLGYDLFYVKSHNLVFDLMVLLRTVEIVIFRVGSR